MIMGEIKQQNMLIEAMERQISNLSHRIGNLENISSDPHTFDHHYQNQHFERPTWTHASVSPKIFARTSSAFPSSLAGPFGQSQPTFTHSFADGGRSNNLLRVLSMPHPEAFGAPTLPRAFSTRVIIPGPGRKRGSDFSVESAEGIGGGPAAPESLAQRVRRMRSAAHTRWTAWLDYAFGIRPYDARLGKQGSKLVQPASRFNSGADRAACSGSRRK